MDKEIWKPIPGYEGLYEVSNMGNVKSLNYHRMGKEKLLKLQIVEGYLYATVSKNSKSEHLRVNRLVWTIFNGAIPTGLDVNHINEDPLDNRLENLNLMTPKENNNWGTRTARIVLANTNGKCSKPVKQFSLDGTFMKEYPSIKEAQRQTNTYPDTIIKCCKGKRKTANGYKWQYA